MYGFYGNISTNIQCVQFENVFTLCGTSVKSDMKFLHIILTIISQWRNLRISASLECYKRLLETLENKKHRAIRYIYTYFFSYLRDRDLVSDWLAPDAFTVAGPQDTFPLDGFRLRKSQISIVSSCDDDTIWNSSNCRRNTRPVCSYITNKYITAIRTNPFSRVILKSTAATVRAAVDISPLMYVNRASWLKHVGLMLLPSPKL